MSSISFKSELTKQTHFKFRNMIGKKVSIINSEGKNIIGNLTFAGINMLHGQFQVTIDRTPYWPVNINTIKLVE